MYYKLVAYMGAMQGRYKTGSSLRGRTAVVPLIEVTIVGMVMHEV